VLLHVIDDPHVEEVLFLDALSDEIWLEEMRQNCFGLVENLLFKHSNPEIKNRIFFHHLG
jgi:hypothetical protein